MSIPERVANESVSLASSYIPWYSVAMPQAVGRRHFIQSLAGLSLSGLSLSGLSWACSKSYDDLGELRAIPSSLPHFQSIRVYPATDYKHVLVHLRQSHESNHDEIVKGLAAGISHRTVACQTSIRDGIGDFLALFPCRSIYIEGLYRREVLIMRDTVNGFRDVVQGQERFKLKIKRLRDNQPMSSVTSAEDLEKVRVLEGAISKFDSQIQQTVRYLDKTSISHSTAIQIAANYNLMAESPNTESVENFLERFSAPYDNLRALNEQARSTDQQLKVLGENAPESLVDRIALLERLETLKAEAKVVAQRRKQLLSKIHAQIESAHNDIYTLREEAVVSLIAERPIAVPHPDSSLVLFGASHDFLPEIRAHNAKNPDNAIALVVLTPNGLGEEGAR